MEERDTENDRQRDKLRNIERMEEFIDGRHDGRGAMGMLEER